MNMVEKIAKAMFDNLERKTPQFKPIGWENYSNQKWFKEQAKIAIEAMKEPTEEMIKEGLKHVDWNMGAKEAYQAMIKVALNS